MFKAPVLRYKPIWLLVGYILIAAVFYLSLTPDPLKIETSIIYFDKINHFTAYFVLMFWFAQIYYSLFQRRTLFIVFVCMGVLIEVLQAFEITRMFEWYDMLANTLGVALAFVITRGDIRFILNRLARKIRV